MVNSFPKSRWNFNKANWDAFSEEMEHTIQFIHPCRHNYNRFCNLIKSIAKKHIPRGFRENYIPGWNAECQSLYSEFKNSNNSEKADELLDALKLQRLRRYG